MSTTLTILIFEDAEVLDVMGPYEVFSLATTDDGSRAFDVRLTAATSMVRLRGGVRVQTDDLLDRSPRGGILLVPGGPGVRQVIHDDTCIAWIREHAADAELVLSVCTGAWLLGKAGLLDGIAATTHHRTLDDLARIAPRCEVRRNERFIDAGRVQTSAGVSAGIDLSLHVVAQRLGTAAHDRVVDTMEWRR